MAGGNIVERRGNATVEIDESQLIALANRITDGAVQTFIDAAHRQMDPVVREARSDKQLWPRRTGRSQAATHTEDRVRPTFVEVVALNPVPYTFSLRFSVVTSDTIDRESRQVAARTWGHLGAKVDRVNPTGRTLRGPFAGKAGARARVASHFIEQASNGVWTKWWPRMDPSEESMRRSHKANLIDRHGTGAPNEQLAGKHVWSTRVRTPLRRREAALIAETRGALDRLAEG